MLIADKEFKKSSITQEDRDCRIFLSSELLEMKE